MKPLTANLPTRHRLLIRLDDPEDREAWDEFVSIYWPLIYRICRQRGLQHADAENVAQDVLRKVESLKVELPETARRGGFRRWLAAVARNAAIDAIRRSRPDAARGGTSVQETLREIQDRGDASEDELRRELERQAFRWAARRVRDEFSETTWAAFWETMAHPKSSATQQRK